MQQKESTLNYFIWALQLSGKTQSINVRSLGNRHKRRTVSGRNGGKWLSELNWSWQLTCCQVPPADHLQEQRRFQITWKEKPPTALHFIIGRSFEQKVVMTRGYLTTTRVFTSCLWFCIEVNIPSFPECFFVLQRVFRLCTVVRGTHHL